MDFIKALYSREFYNFAYRTWRTKNVIGFLVILALVYGLVSGLSFFKYRSMLKLNDNHPIISFIKGLPKSWELKKDEGLSIYDESNNAIKQFSLGNFFRINLDAKDPVASNEVGPGVLVTKNVIYYNRGQNNISSYRMEDYLKTASAQTKMELTSIKMIITKDKERFDNITFYSGNFALKKLALKDIRAIFNKFVFIIMLAIIPTAFVLFIGWKLILALLLSLVLLIFVKIIHKDIKFGKIYLISILIQVWALIFFVIESFLRINIFPRFIPFILMSIFGGFVISKFLEMEKPVEP